MKTYRVLIQRPTKRSAETLVERFVQGEVSSNEVRSYYSELYAGLSVSVEEIKDFTTLKKANIKEDTITKNDGGMYSSPSYKIPMVSLDEPIQELLKKYTEQSKELDKTKREINSSFSQFMNEPSFSNIDGQNIVHVSGYMKATLLPGLRLGAKKDE